MKNLTLSLDDDLLETGRSYAQRHGTSLNDMIRMLLDRAIRRQSRGWLDECFSIMDKYPGDSKGKKWRREDLYEI